MKIREERSTDYDYITHVTDAAFAKRDLDPEMLARIAESMAAAGMDPTAMGKAQTEATGSLSEAQVVETLRRDNALALSLVVEKDGEVIAHIAFSAVRIGAAHSGWYQLGPVSVRPDLQGQGIGSALIREGLARLRDSGAKGCVLLGYPPYYARFGFVLDEAVTWHGRANPALQRLVFAGPNPSGDVAFHPAFG